MNTLSSKKNILIVEDELPLLRVISAKLKKSGYDTFMASRVDEAVEYLKNASHVDAVWLDHYLPNKNGDELVVYMKKENSAYQNIPIFLVSNTAASDEVYHYIHLGITKYFVKADRRLDEIIDDITKFFKEKNL
ncbi:MAG: hypothetical protein C0412_12560 [Flavobacterium sp.]|nr:hypothetical protein [Flavobacterium sp.]